MNRTEFALLMVAIAVVFLGLMWLGWRARNRRDAVVLASTTALTGEVLDTFAHAAYVSTTPVGSPLERVAVPGLRYKGYAEVTVRRDGVSIQVTGEAPVSIAASQVRGSDTAQGRVGKIVERDGLSLLRWHPGAASQTLGERDLESSFRLADPATQRRFAEAIATMTSNSTLDHGANV